MFQNDKRENWFRGKERWNAVSDADWGDWTWQMRHRISTLAQLENLMTLTPSERAGVIFSRNHLAFAVTPYFFNLIDVNDTDCPVRKQVIPRAEEQFSNAAEACDPVAEDAFMPVPGLVHRYPDRVLFLVTDRCAAYCRFCTRSRLVSNAKDYNFHPKIDAALDYIKNDTAIRDVLISGGDPLLLEDAKIDFLLGELRKIPHVEFVRIGSRIPVFMPQRITPALCEIFKKHGPVFLSMHANAPQEITEEFFQATEKLAFAGVVMGSQSVLLRGVNDSLPVMKSLVHRLLMCRVRPYYLYACDPVNGTAHLRAPVEKGIEIIRGLRGFTSGYAVPQFVVDAPGGGGKVPLNPDYFVGENDTGVILKNFLGKEYFYPN